MKMGFRTPNIKKSVKARTTGKMKRAVKKSVNPLYGKKGMGYVSNPKKAVYNKVYNKTTIDARPTSLVNATRNTSTKKKTTNNNDNNNSISQTYNEVDQWKNLTSEDITKKLDELTKSRKKSLFRCPLMLLLFFVFYMISLFSGSFLTWFIAIITFLWFIGSGTNARICKKDIQKLENILNKNN